MHNSDIQFPNNVSIFYYYGGEKFHHIEDKLYFPYPEKLNNIGYKTISSFEYLLNNNEFDYIYRTNSSSYINIENLLLFLKNKPTENFYCGRVNTLNNNLFASGSGYFLSRDLVKYVIENKEKWNHDLIDDVAIGQLLSNNDIKITPAHRLDIDLVEDNFTFFNKGIKVDTNQIYSHFHFRCKTNSLGRIMDSKIMLRIHSLLKNHSLDNNHL